MYKYNNENGFTLVELIVVIVLLALMGSILYGTLNGFIRSKNLVLSEQAQYKTTRYLVERLNRELASIVPERLSISASNNGNRRRARAYMLGTNKKEGLVDKDSLRFVSIGSAQEIFNGNGNHGLLEIEYRLEENPDSSMHSSSDKSAHDFILVREEIPGHVSDKNTIAKHRIVFPIANNVVSLNFRYLERGIWKNNWEKETLTFPDAIEVKIKLRGEGNTVETFFTAIAIKEARPRNRRQIFGPNG